MDSTEKKILSGMALVVFAIIWIAIQGIHIVTETGQCTGFVIDNANTGWIFKADEFQVMAGSGNAAHTWRINCENVDVGRIRNAMETKSPVIVKYKKYWVGGIYMTTSYMATSIELEPKV